MRFKDIVEIEFQQDYYKQLHQFVENEYLHKTIFPPKENIFRALNLCESALGICKRLRESGMV